MWAPRLGRSRTGTRLPPPPAPTHPHRRSPPGQPAWALTRKQELEGEVVLSSGQAPCRERRETWGRGPREPRGDTAGPRRKAGNAANLLTLCLAIGLPASVPSTKAAQGHGLGKGWEQELSLNNREGKGVPGARARSNPGDAGPLSHLDPMLRACRGEKPGRKALGEGRPR